MNRWLALAAVTFLVQLGSADPAPAGPNAAASARIYWQTGINGAGSPNNGSASPNPQFVVTCKGVQNLRGAEVQVLLSGGFGPLTPAWQFEPGGCAEGSAQFYLGGRGGTYPNVFTATPAVPGLVIAQNSALFNTGDCRTPHGVEMLWLSCIGDSGRVRDASKEYAVWAVQFDANTHSPVDGTPCPRALDDLEVQNLVCVFPNFRIPCTQPGHGAAMSLIGRWNRRLRPV